MPRNIPEGFRCPECGSSAVKSREMLYKSGTSYYSGRRSNAGISFGLSGKSRPRAYLGGGKSSGKHQSVSAMDAAPVPIWPALIIPAFMSAAGGVWAWIGMAFAILWGWNAILDRREMKVQWICSKCGSRFIPIKLEQSDSDTLSVLHTSDIKPSNSSQLIPPIEQSNPPLENKVDEYRKHHSTKLISLFMAKPYQGQNPEIAKVIILGNDANYSEEISNTEFFNYILEYHVDGVKFWKKYGVHHPFLLENYPLNKNSGGVPYHRNFSKLGFMPNQADMFSFVELLNVPTIGMTGQNPPEFWNLLNLEHLKWIDSIFQSDGSRIVFISRSVLNRMREIKQRYSLFLWLPDTQPTSIGLQEYHRIAGSIIYVSYSFSAYQIHGEINIIRNTIDAFVYAS